MILIITKMKALKMIILCAILTTALASSADAKGTPFPVQDQKVISLTFSQAMQYPGLVLAMYEQLSPRFLQIQQLVYTEQVVYQDHVVRVTGSYTQWALFFRNAPEIAH
jgi:hypothetical protein